MKKLLVLLLAAAVAVGASAGVNNKIAQNVNQKFSVKEMKANVQKQSLTFKKGDVNVLPGTQLQAFDASARQANHSLRSGQTMFWDFEDEAQVNDWTMLDEDGDGYSWEYVNADGFKTHSGTGCMFSASYDNNIGVLYPDNWLVSPTIELGGTFGFYACGQDPSYASEVFAIYVYVNNEWIKIGGDYTATGVMKAYSADLSEYEGQEGCVAIRHYNVYDMYRLNVDDITIGEFEPEPEPEAPAVITEIPEGCQTYTYYRNSACIYNSWMGIGEQETDGKITVAFDMTNGDVYIQNPAWWHDGYGAWVKGTYDWMTGIITIPTGQYLSWSDAYGYGIILGWGTTYVYSEIDPDDGEEYYYMGYEIDDRTTEIQFMIDDDYLYLLGTEGDINAEFPENYNCTGMLTYWSDDLSMTSLEFCNRDEYGYAEPFGYMVNLVPAVPADPTADDWYDCGDESGFSKFYFTLPDKDVDGNGIDPEYLSYAVWVNDGNGNVYQFTFPAEDYTFDLNNDIDEVPYDLYSSAVDFHNYYVYMYRTNENDNPLFVRDEEHDGNIGIQVFYTVDGERNASNIAWLYEVAPVEPDPHMTGYWLVQETSDGELVYTELLAGLNGDFVNVTDVTYPIFYDVCGFYFLIDGVAYGAEEDMTEAFLGDADMNPLAENENKYYVEVGYSYTFGVHFIYDENTGDLAGYSAYVAKGGPTDVDELVEGKNVANVRYFNVAGQEMAQPSGLTIQVTTYTDGTTKAVKVVK